MGPWDEERRILILNSSRERERGAGKTFFLSLCEKEDLRKRRRGRRDGEDTAKVIEREERGKISRV